MKLNIKQLLRERQIDKPFAFLTKNGFPDHVAVKLLNDNTDRIQYKHLSQLCRILWCTPDQLFVLDEKELKRAPLPPGHPLLALQPRSDAPDIMKKLRQLPLDELKLMDELLAKMREQKGE